MVIKAVEYGVCVCEKESRYDPKLGKFELENTYKYEKMKADSEELGKAHYYNFPDSSGKPSKLIKLTEEEFKEHFVVFMKKNLNGNYEKVRDFEFKETNKKTPHTKLVKTPKNIPEDETIQESKKPQQENVRPNSVVSLGKHHKLFQRVFDLMKTTNDQINSNQYTDLEIKECLEDLAFMLKKYQV